MKRVLVAIGNVIGAVLTAMLTLVLLYLIVMFSWQLVNKWAGANCLNTARGITCSIEGVQLPGASDSIDRRDTGLRV